MNRVTRRVFTLTMIVAALLLIAPRFGRAEEESSPNVRVANSDTPCYPVQAIAEKVAGTVIITVQINRWGNVISGKYVNGPESLRSAAEVSALRWTFNSVKRRAIRTAELSFIFRLKTSEDSPQQQAAATESPFTVEIIGDPAAATANDGYPPVDCDKVGVPECDEYLQKWRTCMELKMPKAALQASESSLRTTVRAWRDVAKNPQTRASLAAACHQADTAAKAGMTAYGCNW